MNHEQLKELLNGLVLLSGESEWVEFKHNFHSPDEIGKLLSALSNGACIRNQPFGYLVFGVEDLTHAIVGTDFKIRQHKKGNEDFVHWLTTRLNPKIDFEIYEFDYNPGKLISLVKIPAAVNRPVEFLHNSYIRINTVTRLLKEFPEKEAKIWKKVAIPFEMEIALDNLSVSDIPKLLSTETYFDLCKLPYPSEQKGVIDKLMDEGLIVKHDGYAVTKLGGILFAKSLKSFDVLNRKAVRVIVYKGKNKVETQREYFLDKGYALGFNTLVEWVNSQLPANEEIGMVIRKDTRMYPEIAVRELIANALIHQDFSEKGFPVIEIFSDRIEISNAGIPLVKPERFIDGYLSRNEKLADIMRRMGFCEEKGSGLDKVVSLVELFQLPPIGISNDDNRTRVTIYSSKSLSHLEKNEKIQACYQHACLKYVSNEKMTNQSLRERLKISDKNASIASRIIKATIMAGLIKEDNPENISKKLSSYVPWWA